MTDKESGFRVPNSVKKEHEELHRTLKKATKAPGELGKAARAVSELLHPHFVKEEEYALPPLAMLPELGKGKFNPETRRVISMTDQLKANLPQMLEEHERIIEALRVLRAAATKSKKSEYVRFSQQLASHAQSEEEILYPAAILVGEYLKLKFHKE